MVDFLLGETSLRTVLSSLVTGIGGYVFFTLPFVIYVLARWRQAREPGPDPQLGVKVAVGYFALAGLQTALLGAVLVLYAQVSKSEDHGDITRIGFALVLPGLTVWALHRIVLAKTNQDEFPGVRRLVAGINLVLCSALGFVSLLVTFQALLAKGSSGEAGRLAVSSAIVYLSAWAYHAWRVFSDRLGMSMGPPLAPPPTQTFTAVAPVVEVTPATIVDAPAPAGLPPLGGNTFPPIK